jgi:hypothetical protein
MIASQGHEAAASVAALFSFNTLPLFLSPGETLFEFYVERDHERWLCELRDQGKMASTRSFLRLKSLSTATCSRRGRSRCSGLERGWVCRRARRSSSFTVSVGSNANSSLL